MTRHAALGRDPADLVGGQWVAAGGGECEIISRNPSRPSEVVWRGASSPARAGEAVAAARAALHVWSRWSQEKRFAVLTRYRDLCVKHAARIAGLISDETGKVMWDAQGEAAALPAKVDITLDAGEHGPLRRVSGFGLPLSGTRTGRCWFRPHGVMAVLAPFNFPMHLANGHVVPALAMGNTVVLKPSDKTPATGQLLVELLDEALRAEGAPPGVVNLVQGGADVAQALVDDDGVDGILFTGSWPIGRKILEANLDRPGRIVALEMGGNNAAVVMPDADLRQAAIECVRSAFATTGQRCTCTRRLAVHASIADRFIPAVVKAAAALTVGDPRTPVFMGPVIGEAARQSVLQFQSSVRNGDVLLASGARPGDGWFLSPGVMQVGRFVTGGAAVALSGHDAGADVEVFGPMLRICIVNSLDDAIQQANATRYGLAASIFTKDAAAAERFLREARAGCVNVNAGTAGASSKLPFGGLGHSGNHRPAGSFSLDYCAYPVAGMIESGPAAQVPPGMTFDDGWLR
ncbi:MAG: aldehyde dehydrogenase family protein [Phycisphaerales bacterium]|nr:aldehyde dehydrogenase family protein [Phycisphaerales bacterium]